MRGAVGMADPPYLRIAAEIRDRIRSGRLRPGDRVPSARQITRDWTVALATATKVLATLRQEGLVRAVPGVGTVVAAVPDPGTAPPPPPPPPPRSSVRPAAGRGSAGAPELTRERVVRTAVGIADAEGLPALSMRRVASELGVATMSLYRHVAGKDELVLLMVDLAFGEGQPPAPATAGWRAQLESGARQQWTIYRHHPWLARLISVTRPPLAPRAMAHTEAMMGALVGEGLDPATALRLSVVVSASVQGIAVNQESEVEAERDTGVTSEEWMKSRGTAFRAIAASGRFPLLARVSGHPDVDTSLDALFEAALELTLDGIGSAIDRRHHASPGGEDR